MTYSAASRPARYGGLDGLRAVAVALVIVYHLFPGWIVPGGFVGVDVFFVISGFLITTLLLRERERTGRIGLRGFWARRARRLLPALVVVVTVCATWAWLVGGDVLARIGPQILGAATFSYNWVSISTGAGYFGAGTPELFRNLWSLAVEEQFYVLWPLLLPLLLLLPGRAVRVTVTLAVAAASAWWMGVLVASEGAVTRAYFGTDSHAFGLLLGVALAFALAPRLDAAPAARRGAGAAGLAMGIAGIAGIVAVALAPASDSVFSFPGMLLAASAATVVAIAAGVWPGSWFGRTIDVAPMRWIGDRSYGLYLWHWPLLVLLTGGAPQADVPVSTGVAALLLTLVAAEASYRLVETPVRRYGFRGAFARGRRIFTAGPLPRLGGVAALGVTALVLGGTTAAIAGSGSETSAESVVAAGHAALEAEKRRGGASATPAPTPAPTQEVPAPAPTPVQGAEITAVGDSVMLASAPSLMARLPGIHVDATVSRSMYAAPGILEQLAASGQLRHYVVLALGTNGPIERDTLERAAEIVGPDRELILVTAHAPREWIPGVNDTLTAFARRPSVELADWASAIAPHEELLAGDRIHPGSDGGDIFAETVAAAVDAAEHQRAEREFRREQREAARDHLPQPR